MNSVISLIIEVLNIHSTIKVTILKVTIKVIIILRNGIFDEIFRSMNINSMNCSIQLIILHNKQIEE